MALYQSSSGLNRDFSTNYTVRSFDRRLQALEVGELDTFRPAWATNTLKKHYVGSCSWGKQRSMVFPRVNKHLLYANLNQKARNSQGKVASLLLQTYSPQTNTHRHCFSVLHRGVAAQSRIITTRFPRI